MYDKEAILESILHQKRESKSFKKIADKILKCSLCVCGADARKLKEFEKQKRKHEVKMLKINVIALV